MASTGFEKKQTQTTGYVKKQTLYLAAVAADADFEDGLDALVTAFPETEAMLQAGIEPCV